MRELFFGCLGLIAFTYLGYPLSLLLLRVFRRRAVRKGSFEPDVSIIVAAHNEESNLVAKLDNLVATDYPDHKREIVVVSDGSTDRTNEIAREYGRGVRLFVQERQGGKEAALMRGLREARADIVLLTDADTTLNREGIKEVVANFHDETVGCVTSEDHVEGRGTVSGEGLYVSYGTWVRRLESDVNSVVGLSGSFCAARKSLCGGLTDYPIDCDLKIAFNTLQRGLRAVNEPGARGYYHEEKNTGDEFKRKLRTTMRGLTAISAHRGLLNPFRYGLTSYQIICHKVLTWCVPYLAAVAFLCSAMLALEDPIWLAIFVPQAVFYTAGLWGYARPADTRAAGALAIATYFLLCQSALVVAWYRVLKGERVYAWRPTNH